MKGKNEKVRWGSSILQRLARNLRGNAERALLSLTEKRDVEGVRVYADGDSAEIAKILPKLRDAFLLLGRFDPLTLTELETRLGGVLVKGIPTQFWPASRICVLNNSFVERSSSAYIALALVFEAVRARLSSTNRSTSEIEIAAVHAQIAFLDQLPRVDWPTTDDTIAYLRDRITGLSVGKEA